MLCILYYDGETSTANRETSTADGETSKADRESSTENGETSTTNRKTSTTDEETSTTERDGESSTSTAAICGMMSEDFVQMLKDGEHSNIFTFENEKITHDPQEMRFFTKSKNVHGTQFPSAESCDIICHTIQDFKNLKESLLDKNFMFKGEMFVIGVQLYGIQTSTRRSGVFTVSPKHPDIAEQLITAFEKVERYAEQGLKYKLRLNFDFSVAVWYKNFALSSLDNQIPLTSALATLSISNGSTPIQWCGECSPLRFVAMCILLPFWVPCYYIEKTYRKCAYKTHEEVIDCVVGSS